MNTRRHHEAGIGIVEVLLSLSSVPAVASISAAIARISRKKGN